MKSTTTNSRRDFLKMSAITGGGLVLGFNWFSAEASAPVVFSSVSAGDINFNSYLDTEDKNHHKKYPLGYRKSNSLFQNYILCLF